MKPPEAGVRHDGAPLRVLGWPAFRNRADQPYNALLYEHLCGLGVRVEEFSATRALTGKCDVLHLHWPDRRVRDPHLLAALARSGALLALLDAVRLRGTRTVWTAHNLQAHDGPLRHWLEPRFWQALTRRLDGVIALSPTGLDRVRERYPALRDVPGWVTPLGHFRGVYPDAVDRADARARLGVPPGARVAAFLGQVRPYKGVVHLVRVFRCLPDPSLRLLVAGRPRPSALATEIREAAGDDARIVCALRFVPDAEIQLYLRAADLVILPFREILNSASAVLALSFDRPVLVPDRGSMADLARQVGAEWVRTYPGELAPELLRDGLEWAADPARPARPALEALEWDRVARATLEAYRALRD
ncbi:MAG: glycosyltransferase [Gemmatimonadota bacterium]|nr:glycosyltransferase [Gemmatimonadota bacterium]